MCASLFLCPLKRVVRVTQPASLSFAPASPTPLRGLRLSPRPYRSGCTLCVVEGVWRSRPRSRARPCSRAPPLSSPPPSPTQGAEQAGFQPPAALPWDRDALRPSGFWTLPLRGPVCTGDAGFSQRDRRAGAALAAVCQSAALLRLLPLDSASAQSPAADRRFRRHSADLLLRAGAPGPPPAGRPSAGQPSAGPKLFGSGKKVRRVPSQLFGPRSSWAGASLVPSSGSSSQREHCDMHHRDSRREQFVKTQQ